MSHLAPKHKQADPDSLPGLSRSDLMSIASARPLPLPLPSHPVPYSVQRATAPFIVSESESRPDSESSDASDGLETEIDDGGHAHPVHDVAARDAERGWGKEWKGPNATALREATQVVIAMRSNPVTFAAEYVALRKQVKEMADFQTATRTMLRDLDAAHEMRIDALERIVASYEDTIRRREWLADHQGA